MNLSKRLTILTLLITIMTTAVAAGPADLTLFPDESSSRIDSFTSYEMEVENLGPVKDSFKFSSSEPSEISIAPTEVTLDSGESRTVNVWYNPAVDKDEGTYSFELYATSQASGTTFTTNGEVNVIKDHDVSVEVAESSQTACLGQAATYKIEVTNDGIQQEEFSLETDYGQLSTERVSLEDGETKTVELRISSNSEIERNFNLVTASITSYAQEIDRISFTAETCFDSEMNVQPQTQDVAAFNQAEFEVSIENLGTKSDVFRVTSSAGELAEEELEVASGETETTTLNVRPEELGGQQIQIAAEGESTSSTNVGLNVQNGMEASIGYTNSNPRYCEDERASAEVRVQNTGAAAETFSLSTSDGNLSTSNVQLEEGESTNVTVNLGNRQPDSYPVTVQTTAETFGEPTSSAQTNVVVENCYDLEMDVLPEVVSAGENRSTVYEIQLNNTGTQQNTYALKTDGPEWVDLGTDNVTIEGGQSENVYLYAGIPFKKEGEVVITATATGKEIQKSKTVRLVVGEDIEEAIESDQNQVSGSFTQSISSFISEVDGNTGSKVIASIVAGLGIVLSALYLI
ncbi:MAG: hypothetical protein H8Z69_02895 [Nanohaloarchaea archaeon]|nr:hypothetical protein [Candidatus Nanohaloarchaea archaeon]